MDGSAAALALASGLQTRNRTPVVAAGCWGCVIGMAPVLTSANTFLFYRFRLTLLGQALHILCPYGPFSHRYQFIVSHRYLLARFV